jgi:uncharacterized protein YdaU (DUF1376 family)
MSKDPAFLFYPNDYLGGTMGMTFEEKGAYMDLLMMQFNRGHMTSHMIGQTVGQLWVNIEDKFTKDDKGLYYNERLEEEQNKRKAFTDSRKNNIKGKNQYTKQPKKRGHMTSHMENENENENKDINRTEILINYSFDEFWNLYDKKVGDKTKLEKKWNGLTDDVRTQILFHVQEYKIAQPEKKFRKDPQTYFNNNSWNDEIIKDNKNGTSTKNELIREVLGEYGIK